MYQIKSGYFAHAYLGYKGHSYSLSMGVYNGILKIMLNWIHKQNNLNSIVLMRQILVEINVGVEQMFQRFVCDKQHL